MIDLNTRYHGYEVVDAPIRPKRRVRIHAGSGDKPWPLWINVDAHGDPDIVSDVRTMPFEASYADEISAIHVVEHIPRLSVDNMLLDWHRILKPGGKLSIEVPCLNKIAQMIVDGEKNMGLMQMGIFGDPRDKKSGMMHAWAYTREELTNILINTGYVDIKETRPKFHIEKRDMRIEARKP